MMRVGTVLQGLAVVVTMALIAGACLLIASAPALAGAIWEPSFGDKNVYTLYDGTEYDDALQNAVDVMNEENVRFGREGVIVVITHDLGIADTLVIDTERGTTGYGGQFWGPVRFQPDEIRLNADRMNLYSPLVQRMVVLHELMHSFGFGHVECEHRSIVNAGCHRKPVDHLRSYDHVLYRKYIAQ